MNSPSDQIRRTSRFEPSWVFLSALVGGLVLIWWVVSDTSSSLPAIGSAVLLGAAFLGHPRIFKTIMATGDTHPALIAAMATIAAAGLLVVAVSFTGTIDTPAKLMIGGSVLTIVALTLVKARAQVAVLVSAITPFEGVIGVYFGILSHLLSPFLMGIFVFGLQRGIIHIFLATRIQRLAALFFITMVPSFIPALLEFNQEAAFALGQRGFLFLFVGLFAYSLIAMERSELILKVLVVSMAAMLGIAMLDFYWGIAIFDRIGRPWGPEGLFGVVDLTALDPIDFRHNLRLIGGGLSINRMATWTLLPLFLSLAWVVTARGNGSRLLAVSSMLILMAALVGTFSRAAFLGFALGLVVVILTTRRENRALLLFMGAAAVAALLLMLQTGLGEIVSLRVGSNVIDFDVRPQLWWEAMNQFFHSNIVVGVGFGNFTTDNFGVTRLGAHGAFFELLVEEGLLSAVFFLLLFGRVIWVLSRSGTGLGPKGEIWRIAVLAGLVGMLVSNIFHVYTYERVLWIAVGFAAAVEFRRTHVDTDGESVVQGR